MDRPRQKSRPRWLVYLSLARVSNLPTIWTNCLAGVSLAGGQFDGSLKWLLVSLSLMYTAGMLLKERRSLGFAMMIVAIAMVAVKTEFSVEPIVWICVLAALNLFHNYRPLFRVMVYFVSAATVGTALSSEVLIGATTLGGYLIGLSYIEKQENLNEVKNLWPLAFLSFPLIYFFRGANLVVAILFVGWVIYALSFLMGNERKIPSAVVGLIAGISLLDAMIISAIPNHSDLVFMAIAGFAATLGFQKAFYFAR